jgi:acyl-CoA thioesterase
MPFSSGKEPLAEGWVRFRDRPTRRDVAHLAALADAWWPALFSIWSAPRPMATVAYTLQVLDGFEGLDPDAPIFHHARAIASRDGYAVEIRELWGEDGRLLALNEQTFVVIR